MYLDMINLIYPGQLDRQRQIALNGYGSAGITVVGQGQHTVFVVGITAGGLDGRGRIGRIARGQIATRGQDYIMKHHKIADGDIVIIGQIGNIQ